nr:MAG TPA: hypothetical protein [Caudoviricetes sp.]
MQDKKSIIFCRIIWKCKIIVIPLQMKGEA